MKKDQVKVGSLYTSKVSDKLVIVRIDSTHSGGGWNATNTATGKVIRVKSAQRLRSAAKGTAKAEAPDATETKASAKASTSKAKPKKAEREKKPKKVSALDAAAKVLAKASKPMRAQELITAMGEGSLWTSPGGKTPHATLYAAMLREIGAKGKESRFSKTDRGLFEIRKAGA